MLFFLTSSMHRGQTKYKVSDSRLQVLQTQLSLSCCFLGIYFHLLDKSRIGVYTHKWQGRAAMREKRKRLVASHSFTLVFFIIHYKNTTSPLDVNPTTVGKLCKQYFLHLFPQDLSFEKYSGGIFREFWKDKI